MLSEPVGTADGFTVEITEPDPDVTYTAVTTAGNATVVDGVVTVTGLEPGETATITVTATRTGYTTENASTSGTALETGTAPVLSEPVGTADGFTVEITEPDPDVTYTAVTTAGNATVVDGVVTVTGLEPGETATITVTATRTGYTTENASTSGTALETGTAPVLSEPVGTADGFTVEITEPDPDVTYTAVSTAGNATVIDGVVTVTGLEPGETATITVTATRTGYTTPNASATGIALRRGTPVVLTAPTPMVGGFEVTIVEPVPGTVYTAITSAGTVSIVDGLITVTGLAPGEAALLTVTAARVGDTDTSARAAGVAPATPEVELTGGDTVTTTTSTPVISGYAPDAPTGSPVTVTVNGQVLTTTVGPDGFWSVTPAALPDGEYEVVVAITVLGVTGTVTQRTDGGHPGTDDAGHADPDRRGAAGRPAAGGVERNR